MPESRDRLSRQDSIIASYSERRISRTGNNNNNGRVNPIAFVLEDDNEVEQAARTPFRWRDAAMAGTPPSIRFVAVGDTGSPRIRRIAPLVGPQNLSPVVGCGRGRGSGGVLPTWYPRRPLNDITAIVRAMERRRERGGDVEGLITETPTRAPHDHDHLEGKMGTISVSFSNKRCPESIGKVPKILLNITHNENRGDTEWCLTPQKKLLNSIDTVEKVVMEELRKLKRTPSAKKAEREKRVRTLMSMR